MTTRRPAGRFLLRTALLGAAVCAAATGCGSPPSGTATERGPATGTWREPAAYDYTLTSQSDVLAGTFHVEVRAGKVVKVTGTDESSRRQVRELPGEVPTLGELLGRMERARGEHAHTARAEYAADGHPVRISLDWDENAIDDEAVYTISFYRPASG